MTKDYELFADIKSLEKTIGKVFYGGKDNPGITKLIF